MAPKPEEGQPELWPGCWQNCDFLYQALAGFSNPGEKLAPSGRLTLLQPLSQTCLEGDLLGWATEKLQGCPPAAMTAWNLS